MRTPVDVSTLPTFFRMEHGALVASILADQEIADVALRDFRSTDHSGPPHGDAPIRAARVERVWFRRRLEVGPPPGRPRSYSVQYLTEADALRVRVWEDRARAYYAEDT